MRKQGLSYYPAIVMIIVKNVKNDYDHGHDELIRGRQALGQDLMTSIHGWNRMWSALTHILKFGDVEVRY